MASETPERTSSITSSMSALSPVSALKSPNLVYYEQGIEDHSVVVDTTIFYDVSDYYGNQYYLIFEYFSNFNNEVE